MSDKKSVLIVAAISWLPYMVVAWLYMELTDGSSRDFWFALGALVVVRLFFSIIEGLGGVVAWKLHGRRAMVARFLSFLKNNNFPSRKSPDHDMLNYIASIEDDPEVPARTRASAKELYAILCMYESIGILAGARLHSASDAALNAYSPR